MQSPLVLLVLAVALAGYIVLSVRREAYGPMGEAFARRFSNRQRYFTTAAERAKAVNGLLELARAKLEETFLTPAGNRFLVSPDWTTRVEHLVGVTVAAKVLAYSPYRSERFFSRLLLFTAKGDRTLWLSGPGSNELMLGQEASRIAGYIHAFVNAFRDEDVEGATFALASALFMANTGHIPVDSGAEPDVAEITAAQFELKRAVHLFVGHPHRLDPLRTAIWNWEAMAIRLKDPMAYLLSFILREHTRTINLWWSETLRGKQSYSMRRAMIYLTILPDFIVTRNILEQYRRLSRLLNELEIEPVIPPLLLPDAQHVFIVATQALVARLQEQDSIPPILDRGGVGELAGWVNALVVDGWLHPTFGSAA